MISVICDQLIWRLSKFRTRIKIQFLQQNNMAEGNFSIFTLIFLNLMANLKGFTLEHNSIMMLNFVTIGAIT